MVILNFIEGETLADAYPLSRHWLDRIGASIAEIHRIPCNIVLTDKRTETFDSTFVDGLASNLDTLDRMVVSDDNLLTRLRDVVSVNRERIDDFVSRLSIYKQHAQNVDVEYVLSHGDVWGGNIVHRGGDLYFLDWESALFAPRERDLFGFNGGTSATLFQSYNATLGASHILNRHLIAYYAVRQQLHNLAQWVQNILRENTSAEQRENDLTMITEHCLNRWDDIRCRLQG